jgi:hypothetical protein
LDKAAQIVERVYDIRFSALCWYLPNRAQLWGERRRKDRISFFNSPAELSKEKTK